MLVKTFGSTIYGVKAIIITAEVSVESGVSFNLVGLPDNAVKESQQRIEAALKYSGYTMPKRKIVINMAPADIRKEGSAYDLTLAIGILAASEQVNHQDLHKYLIMGELSLDGSLQPIKGALPIAIEARANGFEGFILPKENAREAAIVNDLKVYGANSMREVADFLNGNLDLTPVEVDTRKEFFGATNTFNVDFKEIRGQESAKRAMEVAAAGGHNILMVGPPGSGKTMLAQRIPTIMPPLSLKESLETTKLYSIMGKLSENQSLLTTRPFVSPHHTISNVALVGGGSTPHPGEISLAHNGVLFLDEFPEFKREALEVLRQPLEDRVVTISRSTYRVEYPASFMLVAAMNPCPCGHYTDPNNPCTCSEHAIANYLKKISGPLLDRIDIQIEVLPVSNKELTSAPSSSENSSTMRERILHARQMQENRFKGEDGIHCNAQMTPRLIEEHCQLSKENKQMIEHAITQMKLSARAYSRILKVARTVADLNLSDSILPIHLAEAIQYRNLDRGSWGRK